MNSNTNFIDFVSKTTDKLNSNNKLGIIYTNKRQSYFLDHPIFHKYRSETEMTRYLKRLADKDIALNRSMKPLGSCTMKLNAATELIPIAYRGFARIHPFVPHDQVKGYLKLIEDLIQMLCGWIFHLVDTLRNGLRLTPNKSDS